MPAAIGKGDQLAGPAPGRVHGVVEGSVPTQGHEVPLATADELRAAFRRHPAGVAIITTAASDRPVGFTVTSLASVSASPPLLSFNISRTSTGWPTVATARYVAVHMLTEDQAELATRFARSGIDRFAAPTVWDTGPRRVPVLDGCAAWLVAAVEQRVHAGDHAIVVARILHLGDHHSGSQPLIHHNGRYHRAVDHPTTPST